MKLIKLISILLMLIGFTTSAWADIVVNSITASPDPINPDIGESTTFTVEGTEGLAGVLVVKIFYDDQTTLVTSGDFILTEISPGIYTTIWGMKVTAGTYYIRVFNKPTSTYIGPWGTVNVLNIANSVTGTPNPFIPTGTNTATITVEAAPGQTGMYVDILYGNDWYWDYYNKDYGRRLYLTETSTAGVYTVQWPAVGRARNINYDIIWPDINYHIRVYDSAGNQSTTTGRLQLTGVSAVSVSPYQFNAFGGETATITATGADGLNLQARMYSSGTLVRTLTMTETSGIYTAAWNGRDESGNLTAVGTYNVHIYHTGSPVRYHRTNTVKVTAGIASVTVSPNPFIPTGTNTATITAEAAPGQTGMYIDIFYGNDWYWDYYNKDYGRRLYLTETSTAGVYTVQWPAVGRARNINYDVIWPDINYHIRVYDSAGNQSTTTGRVQITGVSAVTVLPTQFNAFGGQTATITVTGAEGLNLQARMYSGSTLVRTLSMTETAGTYTAIWDGRDESGNLAAVGTYDVHIYHTGSPARYHRTGTVKVTSGVTSVTGSPNPFIPTGTNTAIITVEADPGQIGIYADAWGSNGSWDGYNAKFNRRLYLTETSTPGVYAVEWSAVGQAWRNYYDHIWPNYNYYLYVYDSAGNQSTTTGQLQITGVFAVSVSPAQFNAFGGETAAITATGAEGLNLQARMYSGGTLVRTLSMTETAGTYTAIWDGRDESGNLAAVGTYDVHIYHTGSPARYYRTGTVKVTSGVTSVTGSPNPFTPTGTNTATITVEAAPGQTGMYADIWYGNTRWDYYNKNSRLYLTETATPGVYMVQWTAVGRFGNIYGIWPDSNYWISVRNSAGNLSAAKGKLMLTGVNTVYASPNPFTPGGGNFTTITAIGGTGLNLEARIYNDSTNTLTRALSMTEASGTYTAEWDGKDSYGNFAGSGNYSTKVFNADSGIKYYRTSSLNVKVSVFSISASPDPFVPTGSNEVTITVIADPLQSGFTAKITDPHNRTTSNLPLGEIGSEGTYVTNWDGKISGIISKDGTCTIRVYDGSGNQFPLTGSFEISSAKSLSVSPNPFEVTGENNATITAEMASGLNFEAKIGSVRTLSLTESGGIYSATWDGKDTTGNFVPSGTYNVTIWSSDTNIRYDLQTSLVIEVIDTTPPETNITSGPAAASYINSTSVTFTWSGSDDMGGVLAYSFKMDGDAWSPYSSTTSYTFENLAEGSHTFSVKAKDQAENEDPTPSARTFTVDLTPPSPAANLSATSSQTGIKLGWSHSPSSDIYAYRLYWDNGTGAINYSTPYAAVYYPSNTFNVSFQAEGTHKFGLRAVDKAGNEEQNTNIIVSIKISEFNITVAVEGTTFDRGQDVPITGNLTTRGGNPIVDAAVIVDVVHNGYHRKFTAYTNDSGEYRYTFHPRSNEAGTYTVWAQAMYEGLEKSASATFAVLGLYMQPSNITVDMSMNSSKTVNLSLNNIGSTALTDISYTLSDDTPDDLISASVNIAGLPMILTPGNSVGIPVVITASPGDPPGSAVLFYLRAESAEGSSEVGVINVRLHEAVSVPVVTPDPLKVGVNSDEPVTKIVTVTNMGYAPMSGTTFSIHDPETYNWISVVNSDLGVIGPSVSKSCQVYVAAPADLQFGNYVVRLDLNYDGNSIPVYLTVEVTASIEGQVAFKVHDDTGSVVEGAEISLISKEFYVNVTPQGIQEYNDVITGKTDSEGYLLMESVPIGDYRYLVKAANHDSSEGVVTVEPGTTPHTLGLILETNLVDVEFSVTETTIQDQYLVTLKITYTTNLKKPTLYAIPPRILLSVFIENLPYNGEISIRNTSNSIPVRNILLDAREINDEWEITFENGKKTIELESLLPGETHTFGFQADITSENITSDYKHIGDIVVSGEYDYSIDGVAMLGKTKTPIPVIHNKPNELSLPSISYINDETDGDPTDLEYKGTTYRLEVRSNRDKNFEFSLLQPPNSDKHLKAITHNYGGPDAESIILENDGLWTARFNKDELTGSGDTAFFDIDSLEDALEEEQEFYKPHSVGFFGKWENEPEKAYMIPVSIQTIRYGSGPPIPPETTPSGPPSLPIPPSTPMNEHGEVKIEIDQKVSLEREAFNAKLSLKPEVPALEDVNINIVIEDISGNDKSDSFFVVVTQQTGITALEEGSVSGPADINWQIIPSSEAGGTDQNGLNYNISATINYSYEGSTYTYETQTETITVEPMPKLVLDYYAPYVVMAYKPAKIKVRVTNNGAGKARNLVISSAQPRIVENENNIPISFVLNGSSPTPDETDYQKGKITINIGDVPPGESVEGYWLLTTTIDGYFVEFDSTLKHENYLGLQLDPLIEEVNTTLVPAIGGRITQSECTLPGIIVELRQNGNLIGVDEVSSSGAYFISDLEAGDYQLIVKKPGIIIQFHDPINVTVLPDQPTAQINIDLDNTEIDIDDDKLRDCWEIEWFGNLDETGTGDYDGDELSNLEEQSIGTNPTDEDTDKDGLSDAQEILITTDPLDPDTDDDGYSDGEEIEAGTDPLDPDSVPQEPVESPRLLITQWEQYKFEYDANEDGQWEEYYAGCTTIAVGQLINYYMNDYRMGWLERILEGVTVYPRFEISDPPEYWVIDFEHPGCTTLNSYPDNHEDGVFLVSTESPCDTPENEPLISFLWNVALGLDAEFTEGDPASVGSYGTLIKQIETTFA